MDAAASDLANIGTGVETSVNDIARHLASLTGFRGDPPPRRPPPWRGAPYCAGRIEGQALAGLEPADVADGRSAQDRRVAPEHSLKPLLAIQTNDDGTSHSKIH